MTQNNVQKWIDALLSGKYEQGKDWLKTPNGEFCCLGVACDISGLGEWCYENGRYKYVIRDENGNLVESNDVVLPHTVQDWLGLEDVDGPFQAGTHRSLTQLNDDGKPFKEIAGIIKSRPTGLFTDSKDSRD